MLEARVRSSKSVGRLVGRTRFHGGFYSRRDEASLSLPFVKSGGFNEYICYPCLDKLLNISNVAGCAENDDGDHDGRFTAHPFDKPQAVQIWHFEVAENQIGQWEPGVISILWAAEKVFLTMNAIGKADEARLECDSSKGFLHEEEVLGIIINVENDRLVHFGWDQLRSSTKVGSGTFRRGAGFRPGPESFCRTASNFWHKAWKSSDLRRQAAAPLE